MLKDYFIGKKALFFDLDGTIVDSLYLWKLAYIAVMEKNNIGLIDIDDVFIGAYSAMIWSRIIKDYKLKLNKTVSQLVEETNTEYVRMFKEAEIDVREGFRSFVREVIDNKKFKLALVSNSDRSVVTPVLEKLVLDDGIFDLIICGDEVKNRKPRPDLYNTAAKKLGVKSNEVLVFEDSISGSMAASAAKMDLVIIWDGRIKEPRYKGHIFTFVPDFLGFPGNMDRTYWEAIQDEAKRITDEEAGNQPSASVNS